MSLLLHSSQFIVTFSSYPCPGWQVRDDKRILDIMSSMERTLLLGERSSVTKLSAKARMWQWASKNPGNRALPLQSITSVPACLNSSIVSFPATASIFPFSMATSRLFPDSGPRGMMFASNRIRSAIGHRFVAVQVG